MSVELNDSPIKRAANFSATGAHVQLTLSYAERAEIQRQGAKAAARGESAGVNPLNKRDNRPSAAGESTDLWQQRSLAWEQGHAAQIAARRKVRTAASGEPAGAYE